MATAPGEKRILAVSGLRAAAYLTAVLVVLLTFSVLCAEDAVTVTAADRGVNDLREFDFGNSIARIPTGDTSVIYPGAFYLGEDFAAGRVTQEGNTGSDHGDFGTIRMSLLLPPDEVYAISAKSVSYAQRMFVDGKEMVAVGSPTADAASFTPGNRRYLAGFYAQGEATEVILHYSVFVHADGGGRFPMLIGSVENVARAEQLHTLWEGGDAYSPGGTITIYDNPPPLCHVGQPGHRRRSHIRSLPLLGRLLGNRVHGIKRQAQRERAAPGRLLLAG